MERSRFRMPAEWEPQCATWVSWPHNVETWPENLIAAQNEFVGFVQAIAEIQRVNVMTPRQQLDSTRQRFESITNANVISIETNDAWARDYAPTFVQELSSGELASVDWHYNAWGGKYPPFDADQKVATKVAEYLGVENVQGGLCLEGGALEVNSRGALLTTESCVLNPNRNPELDRQAAELIFRRTLGCSNVIWLPGAIDGTPTLPGDDTDGHIDQLARFVDDDTILHAWAEPGDRRHEALKANVDVLASELPGATLVPLQLPPEFELFGRQIPASYCNFLFTNDAVILPQFGFPQHDAQAQQTIGRLLTNRRPVSLDCKHLAVGLGSFHCLSQQQPTVVNQ